MGPVCKGSPVNLPRQDCFPPLEISRKRACLSHSKIHWGTLDANIYRGFLFLRLKKQTYSLHPFKVLRQFSHTTHRLVYGQLSGLILSCAGDASMAVDHGYSNFFFLLFFPALFGRPLAATIDLRVELMTKMTNPWGGRVREIMREMERDREGEQETKTNLHNMGMQSHTHTNAHCTVFPHCSQWLSSAYFGLKHLLPRRDATFMQHKAVISFWVQELLARRWHGVPGADRCCHPNSAARPPTRQELSARAADDPGLCWERDPNLALTTAPITGADLIVSLLGEKKKEFGGNRSAWLQSSMKPWTRYLLLHLQLNTSLKSLLNLQ